MPGEARRRPRMENNTELAPIADTRETEVEEDFGPRREGGGDEGIDDGLVPSNGVPRRAPRPGSFTPVHPQPSPHQPPTDQPTYKPSGRRPLDVNLYATKKTVAQGMMDMALLTANANQLRYILEAGKYGGQEVNYYISLTLIILSIVMQVVIGVALIFLGRYNVTMETHARKADNLNNWVVLGVFIITIINVFISSLSIHPVHPVLLRSSSEGEFPQTEEFPQADVTEKIIQGAF